MWEIFLKMSIWQDCVSGLVVGTGVGGKREEPKMIPMFLNLGEDVAVTNTNLEEKLIWMGVVVGDNGKFWNNVKLIEKLYQKDTPKC